MKPASNIKTHGLTRSASYDEASGTVEIVYATPHRVPRYDDRGAVYLEELEVSEKAIDTDLLDRGIVPLLHDHIRAGLPAGRVISHRIEGDNAIAVVQLSTRDEAAGIVSDIKAGIIKTVSVGYDIIAAEEFEEDGQRIVRATAWRPSEISLTVDPADPNAQIRSKGKIRAKVKGRSLHRSVTQNTPLKGTKMAIKRGKMRNTPAADQTAIVTDVTDELLDEEVIDAAATIVADGVDVDVTAADVVATVDTAVTAAVSEAVEVAIEEVIAEIEEEADEEEVVDETAVTGAEAVVAERRRSAGIAKIAQRNGLSQAFVHRHVSAGTRVSSLRSAVIEARSSRSSKPINSVYAQATRSADRAAGAQAQNAIYGLISGRSMTPAETGRFRNSGLIDIARQTLGHAASGRSNREIASLAVRSGGANSTSDFSFTSAVSGAIDRRVREIYENLEMPLAPIVRETLVNDFRPVDTYSIGGFPELREVVEGAEYTAGTITTETGTFKIDKYGRLLTLTFEAIINDDLRLLDTTIRSIAAKGISLRNKVIRAAFDKKLQDGKSLFHATRGNLLTAALDLDGLSQARSVLRKTKAMDGDPMNLTPKFLIVSPDLETTAQQLVSPITAAVTGEVNPFAANLSLIVDPFMDGNEWIVAGDPNYGDAIELAGLRGYEGVQIEEIPNHFSDGITWRARTFAGAHPTGWRGFVKSTGTGA